MANSEEIFPKSAAEDFKKLKALKKKRFLKENGETDIEKYIEFLNAFNKLIGHKRKPFKPMTGNKFRM